MLGLASVYAAAQSTSDSELAALEARVKLDVLDFIAWNRLGDLYLLRLRETGSNSWLERAERAAEASGKAVPPELNPAGLGLQARVDVAQHRFARALQRSQSWKNLQPGRVGPLAIEIDAWLELGDLEQANKALNSLAEQDGESLTVASRQARLTFLKGDLDATRELWEAALIAVQNDAQPTPVTVAWCQVQIGELNFRTGRWDQAEAAYQAALKARPDWWTAREHLAELRAAQGKDAEAVELFTAVAEETQRPEIWQALGDFHLFAKRPAEAKAAHERALAGYRASIDKGEILYVHHLAGFFSDSQEDAAEAVKWARKDLEQRQGPQAWDVLAWALYRAKDFPAAKEATLKALASGIADTHILYHAAMIHMSSGDVIEGQRLLRRCAEVNPHFNAFHVHR